MISKSYKPRRSALYMPGSNPRALEKAKNLDVDCLIFDLEDAVAPDAKATARQTVVEALTAGGYGEREVVVRINALDTPFVEEDLQAIIPAAPDAILLPKVNNPGDLQRLASRMAVLGASQETATWAMIETPQAILNVAAIAACGQDPLIRLSCLAMGLNDLAKDTRATLNPGRAVMLPWLMTCIAAARAGRVDILDGVYNAFQDTSGFADECAQGEEMGMDGKTLIHPIQIEICHGAFSPSAEEVAWARKTAAIFDMPENAGKGVVQVDGKMVERLHAEMARRIIAISDAISSRGRD